MSIVLVMAQMCNTPREVRKEYPGVADEPNEMIDPVDGRDIAVIRLTTGKKISLGGTMITDICDIHHDLYQPHR